MEIKTKFNINDDVWFIHPVSQLCVEGKIIEIGIKVKSKKRYKHGTKRDLIFTGEYEEQRFLHNYYLTDKCTDNQICKNETQIFKTKSALIDSLKGSTNKIL